MSPPRVTHHDRALRRSRIAQAVREGLSVREAATRYAVTLPTVRRACRDAGVGVPEFTGAQSSTYEIIASLIRGVRTSEICDVYNVTRQRVAAIRKSATQAGIFKAVRQRVRAGK